MSSLVPMAGSSIFSICTFDLNIMYIVLYCICSFCFETLRLSSYVKKHKFLQSIILGGEKIYKILLSKLLSFLPNLRPRALATRLLKKNVLETALVFQIRPCYYLFYIMTKFWGFTKIITSYTKLPQAVKFVSVLSFHNRKILLCQQFMVRNFFRQ